MQQSAQRTQIPPSRQPILEPYTDYLVGRWNAGCRNAQQAYREGKEMGYPGTESNGVRFFGHLRKHFNQSGTFKQVDPATHPPVQAPAKRPPSASQVAHWITFKEEQRLDWQQKYLTQVCEADQEIAEAYALVIDFTTMLGGREGERLDSWLEKVEAQGVAELKNFALGVKRDYDAVKAGLTLAWSQGAVEGHVHRVKLLKRQAYGRASFELLRKRVLQCAWQNLPRGAWLSIIKMPGDPYSVPSRLIGTWVMIRVRAETLEGYVGTSSAFLLPRMAGRHQHHIDYHHLIWSLLRKPGAFAA